MSHISPQNFAFDKKPDSKKIIFCIQQTHKQHTNTNIMSGSINLAVYESEFCDKDEGGQVIKPLQIDGRNRKQLMEILVTRDPKYDSELQCENLIDQPHICYVLLELLKLDQQQEKGGLTEVITEEEITSVFEEADERLRKFTEIYFKKNHGGSGERPVLTNSGVGARGNRGRPRKESADALQAFMNKNHQEGAMTAKQWKVWCEQHDMDAFTPLQFWVDYRIIDGKPSFNTIYKQIHITDKQRITWKTMESVKDGKDNYAQAKKRYEKAEAKLSQTNTPNKMQKHDSSPSRVDSDEEDFMSQ